MTVLVFAALLAQEWQPVVGKTGQFVNPSTMEQKSADDLLKHALARRQAKDFDAALAALNPLVQFMPEGSTRENAHFERAQTLRAAGRFYDAYDDYEKYILRYPQMPNATEAKKQEMECALALAKTGYAERVLGVPLVSTSRTGIDFLKDALRRYPREDFSAYYYRQLGIFYYERRDWDHAGEQFSLILDQYSESPQSVLALAWLGYTNENRFKAVDYDIKPLKDARRFYERFLEEADRMRQLPDPAKDWVNQLLDSIRERLAIVYQNLLEKSFRTAKYYDWKDLPWSSAVYYRSILKDDATFRRVLPGFPETEAVRRAKKRIPEIQAELRAEMEWSRAGMPK
jgi:tetratricopeptide (TPR) repeat protein